jgi:hypothetical protein
VFLNAGANGHAATTTHQATSSDYRIGHFGISSSISFVRRIVSLMTFKTYFERVSQLAQEA